MLKKLIRKILNRFFLRSLDDIKIQKGQLFERNLEMNLNKIEKLEQSYFQVFSQDYEDGIIQYLLKSLKIENVKFVEIGTQDYSESNTRYIFETMKCEGLIIDPTPNLEKKIRSMLKIWKNKLIVYNDFINSKEINSILIEKNFYKDIDVFSLDIDGIDYWVLKALPDTISKIFVIEYNPYFGSEKEVCAPNIEKFERYNYHHTGACWGASLRAIINLMNKKGYTFLGSNRLNVNAFFIRNDLINQVKLKIPQIENLSEYTKYKFNLIKNFNNDKPKFEEIDSIIQEVEVFDIKTKVIKKFKQII